MAPRDEWSHLQRFRKRQRRLQATLHLVLSDRFPAAGQVREKRVGGGLRNPITLVAAYAQCFVAGSRGVIDAPGFEAHPAKSEQQTFPEGLCTYLPFGSFRALD